MQEMLVLGISAIITFMIGYIYGEQKGWRNGYCIACRKSGRIPCFYTGKRGCPEHK